MKQKKTQILKTNFGRQNDPEGNFEKQHFGNKTLKRKKMK